MRPEEYEYLLEHWDSIWGLIAILLALCFLGVWFEPPPEEDE